MTTLVHLGDDELLRLIDGDTDQLQRARWDAHLAACAHCTREAELMRADAALLTATIDCAALEADLPAPIPFAALARRRPTPIRRTMWHATPAWMRAAAVLVLMAAPVAAIPAWREWFMQTVGINGEPDAVVAPASVDTRSVEVNPVRFVPAGVFEVRFDAAQAEGELRVTSASGEEAMFETDRPAGVLPTFSETMLHVRNTPQSTVNYSLQIPASVHTISIRIGAATVATLDAAAIRAGRIVPLQR